MATIRESEFTDVREFGYADRLKHLAVQANPAFAVGSIVVPLAVLAVALALDNLTLLFYTHVATGAIWFAVTIFLAAILGPTLGALDEDASVQFSATFVPKTVFFMLGVSTTTVLSGTVLAGEFGLLGIEDPWVTSALVLGWGLWVFGLVVPNRTHLRAYYEGLSPTPDSTILESVEKQNMLIGLFEAVVMLAIVFVMANLRL